MNTKPINHHCQIPSELAGRRLDQALAELFPQYSRSRLSQWIREQFISVDGQFVAIKHKLRGGEQIIINAELAEQGNWQAQAIPLVVIHEDEDVLVINKPVGLVVHPAAGNPDSTMLNALLHHCPDLQQLPRAGIIHRLDKDTSGILVVAKNLQAHTHLVRELQERNIKREYRAVVQGVLTAGGTVDAPIGRHPRVRIKMAVVQSGKAAVTHYRVSERFRAHSLLKVMLESGRTHQIRVHMTHINHPIVGDQVYGGRLGLPKGATEALSTCLKQFKRQALHAYQLEFSHPRTQEWCAWQAPIADDMQHLIEVLRSDAESDPC